ncbi:hypothetical protein BJ546DRAFT_946595 [Cryomyces antarcticus]
MDHSPLYATQFAMASVGLRAASPGSKLDWSYEVAYADTALAVTLCCRAGRVPQVTGVVQNVCTGGGDLRSGSVEAWTHDEFSRSLVMFATAMMQGMRGEVQAERCGGRRRHDSVMVGEGEGEAVHGLVTAAIEMLPVPLDDVETLTAHGTLEPGDEDTKTKASMSSSSSSLSKPAPITTTRILHAPPSPTMPAVAAPAFPPSHPSSPSQAPLTILDIMQHYAISAATPSLLPRQPEVRPVIPGLQDDFFAAHPEQAGPTIWTPRAKAVRRDGWWLRTVSRYVEFWESDDFTVMVDECKCPRCRTPTDEGSEMNADAWDYEATDEATGTGGKKKRRGHRGGKKEKKRKMKKMARLEEAGEEKS